MMRRIGRVLTSPSSPAARTTRPPRRVEPALRATEAFRPVVASRFLLESEEATEGEATKEEEDAAGRAAGWAATVRARTARGATVTRETLRDHGADGVQTRGSRELRGAVQRVVHVEEDDVQKRYGRGHVRILARSVHERGGSRGPGGPRGPMPALLLLDDAPLGIDSSSRLVLGPLEPPGRVCACNPRLAAGFRRRSPALPADGARFMTNAD